MKVKLKDLQPNPFRNFDLNPFDPDRVKEHERSIKQHGMWLTFRVRKQNQYLQIVFGHHRLQALKNLYGDDYEIDVELVDYDDNKMLLALAAENDPVWNHSIREIDEMVSGAKNKLIKMKETDSVKFKDFALSLFSDTSEDKNIERVGIGAPLIAAFLEWPVTRVEDSLTRVNAIEDGVINREALYHFPSASSAMKFLRIMKHDTIDIEDQHHLAQEIINDGRLGKKSIERAVYHFKKWRYRQKPGTKYMDRDNIDFCEGALEKIVNFIEKAISWMGEFEKGMTSESTIAGTLKSTDDIKPQTLDDYEKALADFMRAKENFRECLIKLELNKGFCEAKGIDLYSDFHEKELEEWQEEKKRKMEIG